MYRGFGQTDDTTVPVIVTASGLPGGATDDTGPELLSLSAPGIVTNLTTSASSLTSTFSSWFSGNATLLAGLAAFATLVLLFGGSKRR